MKLKQNKTQVYLLLIFSLALLIGIGYAALFATLNINGQTTINKASWDIHMEDINVTSGSVTATTVPTLDTAKTTVNFSVKLTNPGDFYEFTVKEVNKGTIDAMVSTISKTGLTATQAKYLDYTVTYDSGLELVQNQILKSGNSEYLRVKVAFKKDVTASDLPTADSTLNLNFSLAYQQAESSAVAIVHPTCKRATILHTTTCNNSQDSRSCSKYGYAIGEKVTFGSLGTTGVLTSGDAFDCDVNGDGVYDSETERFYYVSGKDGDNSSNYATLIYYSNVTNGSPDNTGKYERSNSTENYSGPEVAMKQLPTTEQWKNVKLSTTARDIYDFDLSNKELGQLRVNNFSYSGYAARFITIVEAIYSASAKEGICGGNYDYNVLKANPTPYEYLLENTYFYDESYVFGYHSENAFSWNKFGLSIANLCIVASDAINTNNDQKGVRPAIEVEKTKIAY